MRKLHEAIFKKNIPADIINDLWWKRISSPSSEIKVLESIPDGLYSEERSTKKDFLIFISTFVPYAIAFSDDRFATNTILSICIVHAFFIFVALLLIERSRKYKKIADSIASDLLTLERYFPEIKTCKTGKEVEAKVLELLSEEIREYLSKRNSKTTDHHILAACYKTMKAKCATCAQVGLFDSEELDLDALIKTVAHEQS